METDKKNTTPEDLSEAQLFLLGESLGRSGSRRASATPRVNPQIEFDEKLARAFDDGPVFVESL